MYIVWRQLHNNPFPFPSIQIMRRMEFQKCLKFSFQTHNVLLYNKFQDNRY